MPAKRRRMKGGARLLQLAKKSRIAAQDRRKKPAGKPAPGKVGNVTPLPKKSAGTPVVKKKVVGNSPRGLPGVSVNVSPSRRPPSRRPVSGKRVSINASSPRKPASSRVKKAVGSSSKKKRITIDPSKMPWYTPTTSTTPTKATKPPAKPKPKATKKTKQPDSARKTSATERPYSQLLGNPFREGVDPAESLKFAVNSMGGWSAVAKLPGVLGRIGKLLKKTPKKTPKKTVKEPVAKKTVKREPDSHSIEGFVDEWVRKQDKMKSALRNKLMTGKHTKVEANRLRRALETPRDLKTLRNDLRSRGVSDRKIDAVIRGL